MLQRILTVTGNMNKGIAGFVISIVETTSARIFFGGVACS